MKLNKRRESRLTGLLLGAALMLSSHPVQAVVPEVTVHQLANDFATYHFSATESAIRMLDIVDGSGNTFPFAGELWKLRFELPNEQRSVYLDNISNTADCRVWQLFTPHIDVEQLGTPSGLPDRTLYLQWTNIVSSENADPLSMTVLVTVTLSQGAGASPRAYWRIAVDDGLDKQGLQWVLREVNFPWLHFSPPANVQHDYLALSDNTGKLIRNPITSLQQSYLGGYGTGSYSMQVNAYYSDETGGGLYFAALDSRAQPKDFEFRTDPVEKQLRYTVVQPTSNMKSPSLPPPQWNWGNDFDGAGVVHVIGPFSGDWYDAAAIYRSWALQQRWARYGRVINRSDPGTPGFLPEYLREGEILTLYFSPQVEESAFDQNLLPDYLAQYVSFFGVSDIIFQVWHWWWNRDMFLDMRNNPWSVYQPLWYYSLNMPEYTGGGDYVGDNQPERMRSNFPELMSALHQIPNVTVHTTVSPVGAYSVPFDHFTYDWTNKLVKNFSGYRTGMLCVENTAGTDALAGMLADWETYTGSGIDGIYMGYGFYNQPCYDVQHTHFTQDQQFGGGFNYVENIERFTQQLKDSADVSNFVLLTEGINETSCPAGDMTFIYYIEGAQNSFGSPEPTFDGNNLFPIPFFQTVYHDYILTCGMIYPFSGIYYNNEYFDGSYVTPSRTADCSDTTFDYFPFDPATSSYPAYDAMLAMQFDLGSRINVADIDQATGPDGAVRPNERFLERGGTIPDDPLGRSRRFLRRLIQSQRYYGIDAAAAARRFMILGQVLRPPEVSSHGMIPCPEDTLLTFDNFFYLYCVVMAPSYTADPHEEYKTQLRVLNVLRSSWYLPELNSTLIVLTNWTSYDQTVDLTFDLREYNVPSYQPSYLTEIGATGYNPSKLWQFQPGAGSVTITNLSIPKRQIKMYQLYLGTPPQPSLAPLTRQVAAEAEELD